MLEFVFLGILVDLLLANVSLAACTMLAA